MAFFDSFNDVTKKAQDRLEIARLNSTISDEEKKRNAAYAQIGKLYVSIHGGDGEPDFAGMLTMVAEAERRIEQLRKQVMDLKGVCRCEKCGAEVQKGMAFCNLCGNAMPRDPALDGRIHCAGCGAFVDRTMRFCTSCGRPMAPVAAPVEPTPVEAAPTMAAEPVEEKYTCPACGCELAPDDIFCTNCGTRI